MKQVKGIPTLTIYIIVFLMVMQLLTHYFKNMHIFASTQTYGICLRRRLDVIDSKNYTMEQSYIQIICIILIID
jgi:hypothetical protein